MTCISLEKTAHVENNKAGITYQYRVSITTEITPHTRAVLFYSSVHANFEQAYLFGISNAFWGCQVSFYLAKYSIIAKLNVLSSQMSFHRSFQGGGSVVFVKFFLRNYG